MSASPRSDRIDFDALIDRLRILPTSQSWSAVVTSMNHLESRGADSHGAPTRGGHGASRRGPAGMRSDLRTPEFQDDVQTVQGFATTIRKTSPLIARSIACAAALARFGRVGDSIPIYRALETLSLAYRFTSLSAEEELSLLDTVWTELQPFGKATLLESPPVIGAADVETYFTSIHSMLAELRDLGPVSDDILATAQAAAWRSVNLRYEDIVRGRPEQRPHFAECACRMANVPPASMLAFSVRDTPATAWADLIVPGLPVPASRKTRIPTSAFAIAAHALGFRSTDAGATMAMLEYLNGLLPASERGADGEFKREASEVLAKNDHLARGEPFRQAVFVIRREIDSVVTRWPTCERLATLPLTQSQFNTLLGGRSGIRKYIGGTATALPDALRAPRDCMIAIEYPPDSPDAAELGEALLTALAAQPRKTDSRVMTAGFGPPDSSHDQQPFIPSPTRYEDLIPASLFSRSRMS